MDEGFKRLIAWQKAYELSLEIYKITRSFPKHEQYGLISQIRRAVISIAGNIAEGYERQYRKEYIHFLTIAKGSLGEIEVYILFSKDFGYISTEHFLELEAKRQEVAKILSGLIKSLKA